MCLRNAVSVVRWRWKVTLPGNVCKMKSFMPGSQPAPPTAYLIKFIYRLIYDHQLQLLLPASHHSCPLTLTHKPGSPSYSSAAAAPRRPPPRTETGWLEWGTWPDSPGRTFHRPRQSPRRKRLRQSRPASCESPPALRSPQCPPGGREWGNQYLMQVQRAFVQLIYYNITSLVRQIR